MPTTHCVLSLYFTTRTLRSSFQFVFRLFTRIFEESPHLIKRFYGRC